MFNKKSFNKGSFSLELITIVLVVIFVALLGLRTFGGQISNTIHDSTNTVETVTDNVLNQYNGSGTPGGSGSGSTPVVTANYYKHNTYGNIIETMIYNNKSPEEQSEYSEHYGDVYEYWFNTSDPANRVMFINESGTLTYYETVFANGEKSISKNLYSVGDLVNINGVDTTVTSCDEKVPDRLTKVQ